MTRLLRTDEGFRDTGKVSNYTLDLAFGDDENDFELTVPPGISLKRNTLVYVPETEWGGLIREESVIRDQKTGLSWRTYKGPTWHGLLDQRVMRPSTDESHVILSGDVNSIIAQVISQTGLTDIFSAVSEPFGKKVTWQFDRYCTVYEGLRKMLRNNGFRLDIRRGGSGKTVLSAKEAHDLIEERGSKIGYSFESLSPTNHLVCIGVGEMEERTIVDLFADAQGVVSESRTIFGRDEIQERYEFTTADRQQLLKSGTERLQDRQVFIKADLALPEGGSYVIDDIVGVADSKLGKEFSARISKVIVKCSHKGKASVSFDFSDIEVKEGR